MFGTPHPPIHPASRPRDVSRGHYDLYRGRCVWGAITKFYDRMGKEANRGISSQHPNIRPDMRNGMRGSFFPLYLNIRHSSKRRRYQARSIIQFRGAHPGRFGPARLPQSRPAPPSY